MIDKPRQDHLKDKLTVAKAAKAVLLAIILALLLGILGNLVAEEDHEGQLSAIFFVVGLVGFSILLIKVQRVGFWFCLSYAIEWALLPVTVAINASQDKGVGCAGVATAIASAVLLAITIPVGAIGFLIFLLLALFVFRKRN